MKSDCRLLQRHSQSSHLHLHQQRGCAGVACGELLANGDFENNSAASTLFNLTNADFAATMADATAFGTAEELDIVTGLDFGSAPISGDWKVGLHSQDDGDFDAFSLDLVQPVSSGTPLTLSFFAVGEPVFGSPLGTVDMSEHGPHWPRTSRKSVISTSPLRVMSAGQEPGMASPTVTADPRARRRW